MSASLQKIVPVISPAEQHGAAASADAALKHGLDPAVEADLAKEVDRLVAALYEFSSRSKAIYEAAPAGASFHKLIASTFALFGFQLANSLFRDPEGPSLLGGDIEYLKQLDARLSQAFHQFEFGGRKYLGIACIDDDTRRLLDGIERRDES